MEGLVVGYALTSTNGRKPISMRNFIILDDHAVAAIYEGTETGVLFVAFVPK